MPIIVVKQEKTFTNVASMGLPCYQERSWRWTAGSRNIKKQIGHCFGFRDDQYQRWPSWYRRLWSMAAILCFALCVYQISDRVKHYLSDPYTTSVKLLTKQPMPLPRFTFCSGLMESNVSLVEELLKGKGPEGDICQFIKTPSSSWNMNGGETEVRRLWETEYINETMDYDMKFKSPTGSLCHVDTEYTQTVYGSCITLSVPEQVKGDSGGSLRVRRNLSRARVQDCFRVTRVLIHQDYFSARHKPMVSRDIKIKNSAARLVISRREFNYLNHRRDPCSTYEARARCFFECIHANLSAQVNCSLPYMPDSSLPACHTFPLAGVTYAKTYRVYKDAERDNCHCLRSCTQIFYQKNLYIDKMNYSNFELTIEVDNDIVEIITEEYVYSLVSLLGDVGGNLGLYLGVCVMSLLNSLGSILVRRK